MSNLILKHSIALTLIFVATIALTVVAMNLNIRTVPINENVQGLERQINSIVEKNTQLQLGLEQILTYKAIKQRAETTLGMQSPQTVQYINRDGQVIK